MKNTSVILLLLFGFYHPLFSEQITGIVNGKQKQEDLKPLSGASIRWLGTTHGAITKSDGTFIIERSTTDSLVASYVGYKPDTLVIASHQHSVVINLEEHLESKEVRVTAESGSIISNSPIKTEEISSKKLEQSACCSLAESFEKSASVEVSFSDAATGARQIQLLGLRGIYTQIITEAIPTIRGLATNFGLEYIPGAFIDNISISKGAASISNGYDGITGQINIAYKQPQKEIPLFVNGYGNSMGRIELNITSAQNLSDNWQTMAMIHGRKFTHEQDSNEDGFIDMPKFEQYNAIARVFHRSDEGLEFQLFTKGLHDEYTSGSTTQHKNILSRDYLISTQTKRYEFFSKIGLNPLFESPETNIGIQISGTWHDTRTQLGEKLYTGLQKTFQVKAISSTEFSEDFKFIYGLSFLLDDYNEQFLQKDFLRRESVPEYLQK